MKLPVFLDCEASSLSHDSYPIEIAWSCEEGDIESHLINPELYPENYTDWDPAAQRIHKLSRNFIVMRGEEPTNVASKLNASLDGKTVYTDAPQYDEFWCDRLFSAVKTKRLFKFANITVLLKQLLPPEFWSPHEISGDNNIFLLYERARKECGLEAHRAANDVAYFIKLYQLAHEISEKLRDSD